MWCAVRGPGYEVNNNNSNCRQQATSNPPCEIEGSQHEGHISQGKQPATSNPPCEIKGSQHEGHISQGKQPATIGLPTLKVKNNFN
jgi:hypothetical protein